MIQSKFHIWLASWKRRGPIICWFFSGILHWKLKQGPIIGEKKKKRNSEQNHIYLVSEIWHILLNIRISRDCKEPNSTGIFLYKTIHNLVSCFFLFGVCFVLFCFLRFICLTQSKRESTSRRSWREREKQAFYWGGSPMQGLIPEPWDHDLSWRQTLNQLSHPGSPTIW